jgi:hypothetical protein
VLYQSAAGRRLIVVSYAADGDYFRASKPQVWGEGMFGRSNLERGFDLHVDGRRIAAAGTRQIEGQSTQDNAVFVFNFFGELRQAAPTKK